MNEIVTYSIIMILAALVSAISQVMLKKSAQKNYSTKIKEYLNPLVISAYILFFGTTFISMYALKIIPLSMAPILEASGYIFVTVLSYVFLHEKVTKKQGVGMFLIVVGIIVYTMLS